jgi:hypothetical protein
MAVPAYPTLRKSTVVSNVISGGHADRQTDRHTHTHTHTDRQAGELINPLPFSESRLKTTWR